MATGIRTVQRLAAQGAVRTSVAGVLRLGAGYEREPAFHAKTRCSPTTPTRPSADTFLPLSRRSQAARNCVNANQQIHKKSIR